MRHAGQHRGWRKGCRGKLTPAFAAGKQNSFQFIAPGSIHKRVQCQCNVNVVLIDGPFQQFRKIPVALAVADTSGNPALQRQFPPESPDRCWGCRTELSVPPRNRATSALPINPQSRFCERQPPQRAALHRFHKSVRAGFPEVSPGGAQAAAVQKALCGNSRISRSTCAAGFDASIRRTSTSSAFSAIS